MDAQACLDILAKAAREHSCGQNGQCEESCAQGCRLPGRPGFCQSFSGGRGIEVDVDESEEETEGGDEAARQPRRPTTNGAAPPPPPAPAAAPCGSPGGGAGPGAGQLLDLQTGKNETIESDMSEAAILERFPELRPPLKETDPQRQQHSEGQAESGGMKPSELATTVVKLHEVRVAVHRAYDGAFKHLLKGQGGGAKAVARTYPSVVACATARFQALSEAARAAAVALEAAAAAAGTGGGSVAEAAALVRKVQGLEQARLQLVAMHHIEQSQLQTPGGGNAASCARLRQQLGSTAEEIEETVSELRIAAAELREEEVSSDS